MNFLYVILPASMLLRSAVYVFSLSSRLWEHCPDCLLEAWEAVHAEEQHILHTAVSQIAEHSHPEPGTLVGSHSNAGYLLVSFRCDAQHHTGRPAQNPAVFPDLVVNAVHKHERIHRVQRLGLPFPDLRRNFVRDLTDHLGRHLYPIQILQLVVDIPGAHSPAIE